jgi:hypothetical protein
VALPGSYDQFVRTQLTGTLNNATAGTDEAVNANLLRRAARARHSFFNAQSRSRPVMPIDRPAPPTLHNREKRNRKDPSRGYAVVGRCFSVLSPCNASFFLIGQVIEFTCDLLELRSHCWAADRVGSRAHTFGVSAILPDKVRGLVVHFSANLFRSRITCVAYHLPPLALGYRARSSERARFSAASAASSLFFAWIA